MHSASNIKIERLTETALMPERHGSGNSVYLLMNTTEFNPDPFSNYVWDSELVVTLPVGYAGVLVPDWRLITEDIMAGVTMINPTEPVGLRMTLVCLGEPMPQPVGRVMASLLVFPVAQLEIEDITQ